MSFEYVSSSQQGEVSSSQQRLTTSDRPSHTDLSGLTPRPQTDPGHGDADGHLMDEVVGGREEGGREGGWWG